MDTVLHSSELTKLSNDYEGDGGEKVVLHSSELTKLSNGRELHEFLGVFYTLLN